MITMGELLRINREAFQVLVKRKTPSELKEIVQEAEIIKINLEKMLHNNTRYSEHGVRKMQRFFNDVGGIYLGIAMKLSR